MTLFKYIKNITSSTIVSNFYDIDKKFQNVAEKEYGDYQNIIIIVTNL